MPSCFVESVGTVENPARSGKGGIASSWLFFQRILSCACLLLSVSLAAAHVQAQPAGDRFTPCTPSTEFIEIKVKVKATPATTTTPEKLHWLLEEIPSESQVAIDAREGPLKNTILQTLQEFRDSSLEFVVGEGGKPPEPGGPMQFETQLQAQIDTRPNFMLHLPVELTHEPRESDRDHSYTVRLCLTYDPTPKLGKQIRVSTLGAATAPLPEISVTLAEAAADFAGRPEGKIPVRVVYAQQDLDDSRRDPAVSTEQLASASVRAELLKVAASAFIAARDNKLLDLYGEPLVDERSGGVAASDTQDAIKAMYNLNDLSTQMHWGRVQSHIQVINSVSSAASPAPASWDISVTDVQLAQSVEIDVIRSPAEIEFDGSVTEKKFDQKRQRVREQLRNIHLADGSVKPLSARPGHVITAKEIDSDQELLLADKDSVKSVGDLTSGPSPANGALQRQRLIYTVSRPLKAERLLNFKYGGGYSPEEHLSGALGIEETNWLGFTETAKLDYAGGPQVQKIRFNFDRPFQSTETSGWHMKTLSINVQYFADKDKRFANLTAQEIADRETGSEARLSFGYDSFSILDHAAADCLRDARRKRTRFYLTATPVLGYRDVNIKEDDRLLTITHLDKSLLPQARTQTTTLSLDGNLGVSHDFRQPGRAGLGKFDVTLNGRLQRGFRLFGADYKYNKTFATLSTELLFGFVSAKDFLLRHNHTMGMGTRGTPVFELFRLGGPQSVRGLEEGEIIGRRMSADQVELGVNLMLLRHWITKKPVAEAFLKDNCPDDAESESTLPFDINNTYIKVFYDRGRIHDRDSFVIPGALSRTAQGYGVALELRKLQGKNINLSIGYAHSPESRLHKSGAFYIGVSYTP
jgi:Omp85 superfamily domain